jgi:hypothetical protein
MNSSHATGSVVALLSRVKSLAGGGGLLRKLTEHHEGEYGPCCASKVRWALEGG